MLLCHEVNLATVGSRYNNLVVACLTMMSRLALLVVVDPALGSGFWALTSPSEPGVQWRRLRVTASAFR
jgi:hypothetical protein